jgi:hypothetical protein
VRKHGQCANAVFGGRDFQTLARQRFGERSADGGVVVDDENATGPERMCSAQRFGAGGRFDA